MRTSIRGVVSLIRVLILQDLFWGYRKTKKIPRYTIVRIMEEFFVITALILIFRVLFTINNYSDLCRLIFLVCFVVHITYAFLTPPLYNFLGVKNYLKPVPLETALTLLSTLLFKCKKHVNKIYITGSLCHAFEIRDVDFTLVPKSFLSAYILCIYLRIWILKFITRRIPFLPDIYIHECNIYSFTCEQKFAWL